MSDSVLSNGDVADVFQRIADIMEVQGENPFKIKAYRNAVKTLEALPEPVSQVAAEDRLDDISGFGEAIRAKTLDILRTGTTPLHDRLKDEVPEGVLTMLSIPGLGPKTLKQIWQVGKIPVLFDELERRASEGALATIPGMGEKSAVKILAAIEKSRRFGASVRLGDALPDVEGLVAVLQTQCPAASIEIAGALRRGCETVVEASVVMTNIASQPPEQLLSAVPQVRRVTAVSDGCAKGVMNSRLPIEIHATAAEQWGAALLWHTGDTQHVQQLQEFAATRGLAFNDGGLKAADGTAVPCPHESDVYAALGLPWIAPELRDWPDCIPRALAGSLPNLVKIGDIRGDCHAHTTASDGTLSIAQMAAAAKRRGYAYMAITDHSWSLRIANGLTPERLLEQLAEIRRIGDSEGIPILAGSEVDIRSDGTLDFDDVILEQLDLVIVSAHLHNNQPIEQQTARVIRAMENPHVDLVAHPTGQLVNRRDPFAIDVQQLIEAAARTNTALEINAAPDRLDLKDTHVRMAKEAGVKIMINTDAHSERNYDLMRYGIMTARRGGLEASDILNCLPFDQFAQWLKR